MLTDVSPDMRVWKDEAFGPLVSVSTYRDIQEAFDLVNDSRYGLQAGVFTSDLEIAFRAHRELEVGAVMIGDSPSFRADPTPYGGWKESGVGREGIRFAMDELTAPRVLVLSGVTLCPHPTRAGARSILLAWAAATRRLLVLDGELALAKPKRLRHRLLHVAPRSRTPTRANNRRVRPTPATPSRGIEARAPYDEHRTHVRRGDSPL